MRVAICRSTVALSSLVCTETGLHLIPASRSNDAFQCVPLPPPVAPYPSTYPFCVLHELSFSSPLPSILRPFASVLLLFPALTKMKLTRASPPIHFSPLPRPGCCPREFSPRSTYRIQKGHRLSTRALFLGIHCWAGWLGMTGGNLGKK